MPGRASVVTMGYGTPGDIGDVPHAGYTSSVTPPDATSINGAAPIALDDTSIAVVGTTLDGPPESMDIDDGTTTVEQTSYAVTDATNAVLGGITRGNLPTSLAGRTLTATAKNAGGSDATPLTFTLNVETGWSEVAVGTPNLGSTSVLSLLPTGVTAATGDVIEWYSGGSITIANTGVVTGTPVEVFAWRFFSLANDRLYKFTAILNTGGTVAAFSGSSGTGFFTDGFMLGGS